MPWWKYNLFGLSGKKIPKGEIRRKKNVWFSAPNATVSMLFLGSNIILAPNATPG
jgi:hypothetical protein